MLLLITSANDSGPQISIYIIGGRKITNIKVQRRINVRPSDSDPYNYG